MAPFNAEDFKEDKDFETFIDNKIKEATGTLTQSNEGLKKDLKKFKDIAKSFDGIDLEALKSDAEKYQKHVKAKESGETEEQKALRIQKEQNEKERKELMDRIGNLENHNKNLAIDGPLSSALAAARVKPELIEAAKQIIRPNVSVLAENGSFIGKVGDKSISDFVAEWAGSDVGKNFVVAASNSGGGGGGGGPVSNEHPSAKFYDRNSPHYNLTEQIKISKSDKDLHANLLRLFKK